MSEPFIAEIRAFGFNFAPRGWALCDGQLLQISQNSALFSLLGTTYGGDGRTTFGLPDLRGRTPLHPGSAGGEDPIHGLGEKDGELTHSLSVQEMPGHDHALRASAEVASSVNPGANLLAKKRRFGVDVYAAPANLTALADSSVSTTGGGQGHANEQPFLVLNFCIALQGVFPSRN